MTASETSIDVAFSPKNRGNIDTIVALELDRPAMELEVINPNVFTSAAAVHAGNAAQGVHKKKE